MDISVVHRSGSAVGKAVPALSLARPFVADPPYTLRDLLTAAFYHRRVMLVAFALPVLLGLIAALISPPAFVAQARLLVLYGSEYFYQPVTAQPGGGVALDRNEIMQGELQILQSPALAQATLQAVGLDQVYPGTPTDDRRALDRAVLRMSRDLAITAIPQSSVLELSFRNRDPEVAAAVLRALISGYLERRAAIFQHAPTPAEAADQAGFLTRLRQAEAALASFADAHGIANVDQQISLLVQRQSDTSQARNAVAQAISETTASLASVQRQARDIPPTELTFSDTDRSQTVQVLTEALARLRAQRGELASRYQDGAPLLRDTDRRIGELQAQIAREPGRQGGGARSGVNLVYQNAQAQLLALTTQLAGLRAKAAQLAATATEIDARVMELNRAARQYRDLQRNRDLLDEAYRTMTRGTEDTRIADAAASGRTANIRVVQPPEPPTVSSDLRLILCAGGLVVGGLAALAALALANSVRQVFISARDASVGLDLPVLAAVANWPGGAMPAAGSQAGPRPAHRAARREQPLARRILGRIPGRIPGA